MCIDPLYVISNSIEINFLFNIYCTLFTLTYWNHVHYYQCFRCLGIIDLNLIVMMILLMYFQISSITFVLSA